MTEDQTSLPDRWRAAEAERNRLIDDQMASLDPTWLTTTRDRLYGSDDERTEALRRIVARYEGDESLANLLVQKERYEWQLAHREHHDVELTRTSLNGIEELIRQREDTILASRPPEPGEQ